MAEEKHVYIEVLGKLRICVDGKDLTLPRSKYWDLFRIVALHEHQSVPATGIWPSLLVSRKALSTELDPETIRRSLNNLTQKTLRTECDLSLSAVQQSSTMSAAPRLVEVNLSGTFHSDVKRLVKIASNLSDATDLDLKWAKSIDYENVSMPCPREGESSPAFTWVSRRLTVLKSMSSAADGEMQRRYSVSVTSESGCETEGVPSRVESSSDQLLPKENSDLEKLVTDVSKRIYAEILAIPGVVPVTPALLNSPANEQQVVSYKNGGRQVNWDLIAAGAVKERALTKQALLAASLTSSVPRLLVARGPTGCGKSSFIWDLAAKLFGAGESVFSIKASASANAWVSVDQYAQLQKKRTVVLADRAGNNPFPEGLREVDGPLVILTQATFAEPLPTIRGETVFFDLDRFTQQDVQLQGGHAGASAASQRDEPNIAAPALVFSLLKANPQHQHVADVVRGALKELRLASELAFLAYAHVAAASTLQRSLPFSVLTSIYNISIDDIRNECTRELATKFLTTTSNEQSLSPTVESFAALAAPLLIEKTKGGDATRIRMWLDSSKTAERPAVSFVASMLRKLFSLKPEVYVELAAREWTTIQTIAERASSITECRAWILFYLTVKPTDWLQHKRNLSNLIMRLPVESEEDAQAFVKLTKHSGVGESLWHWYEGTREEERAVSSLPLLEIAARKKDAYLVNQLFTDVESHLPSAPDRLARRRVLRKYLFYAFRLYDHLWPSLKGFTEEYLNKFPLDRQIWRSYALASRYVEDTESQKEVAKRALVFLPDDTQLLKFSAGEADMSGSQELLPYHELGEMGPLEEFD